MKVLEKDSTMYRIVGCAMNVYNELKFGFLESVYEKALEWELLESGFSVRCQVQIPVLYRGVVMRDFYADLIVEDVIIEVKAVSNLRREHEAQLLNYLKATGCKNGLLVNFGNFRKLEWRKVTN